MGSRGDLGGAEGGSLQSALGHGDRRDWRGVNREVGWAGGMEGLLAVIHYFNTCNIGYLALVRSTEPSGESDRVRRVLSSLWDLRPGRGSRGPSDSGGHKAKRRCHNYEKSSITAYAVLLNFAFLLWSKGPTVNATVDRTSIDKHGPR